MFFNTQHTNKPKEQNTKRYSSNEDDLMRWENLVLVPGELPEDQHSSAPSFKPLCFGRSRGARSSGLLSKN